MTETQANEDQRVRQAVESGDAAGATTLVLQRFAEPVMGYLVNVLRDEGDASEVFALFAEDVWQGLPRFQWRASLRTWVFTLARNAAHRYRKQPHRRAERNQALSDHEQVSQMIAQVRERTLVHLRTETKTRVQALREQLDEEEQTVLMLHVDQQLSFPELARVMLGEAQDDPAALEREAARLRKRFQVIKRRLRELAEAAGLLDGE